MMSKPQPNLVFVFADQLRYQATGFGGDPNVHTPHLDALAEQSINFTMAVSGCPVCCPARASLLTGQYPHEHGVFMNDVCLGNHAISLAQAFATSSYTTAYIGKWHLDGHGRSNYIPPERRQGFTYWQALECSHDYYHSYYYAGNDSTRFVWSGYDAEAQTRVAQRYIREHAGGKPFVLLLSWGPPHNPYDTAPERYRRLYDPATIKLRPNVPIETTSQARLYLSGYYAHVSALDDLISDLLITLDEESLADNTVFVFWSDHGDMLGSQGEWRKQRPWDESIRVPLLLRYPALGDRSRQQPDALINTPDLMPTLLSLCGIGIPSTVTGLDYTPYLQNAGMAPADAALVACYQPFGEYARMQYGGREYRGVRTTRYTYIRDLAGPWLLYDNLKDPFQQENVVNTTAMVGIQAGLENRLAELLRMYRDEFLPGGAYLGQWNYPTDESGTVPYTD